jgi:hypothetical protein
MAWERLVRTALGMAAGGIVLVVLLEVAAVASGGRFDVGIAVAGGGVVIGPLLPVAAGLLYRRHVHASREDGPAGASPAPREGDRAAEQEPARPRNGGDGESP